MNLRNTIHSHFVLPLLRNAGAKGLAPEAILQSVDLSPEVMHEPRVRFTLDQYTAILRTLWKELDDEFFGLSVKPVHFGTFALFCELSMKEGRVGAALEKQAECFKLATESIRWDLSSKDEQVLLSLAINKTEPNTDNILTEYLLAMTHRFAGWLAGQRIPLTQACFDYPRPNYVNEYDVLFGCSYLFDQPAPALEFPKACLNWPIVRTSEELIPFLKQSPVGMLVRPETDKSFVIKVRRILLDNSGEELEFPGFEEVADKLGVSAGTLRRRLKEDETSYQILKDGIRRDVAIELLCDPSKSVFEVAYAVGFSETSTFSRAFKAWTGLPPTAYRDLGEDGLEGEHED